MRARQLHAIVPARTVEVIAGEIKALEVEAEAKAVDAITVKVEIGKRLIEAKELLPHGQFIPWVGDQFGWTRVHAERHMLLARNATRVLHLPPGASLRMALKGLKDAEGQEREKPKKARSGRTKEFDFDRESIRIVQMVETQIEKAPDENQIELIGRVKWRLESLWARLSN